MPFEDFTEKEARKRPSAELNERWWKQAWPGESNSKHQSAMTTAIKKYKVEKRGKSLNDLSSALADLKKCTGDLRKEASTDLKKYPNRLKSIKGDLDDFDKLVTKEEDLLTKFGAKTVVVYQRNLGPALVERVKKISKHNDFEIKADLKIKHELLEAVVAEIETKNALAMMNMQFNYAFDSKVKECAVAIKKILDDPNVGSKTKFNDIADSIQKSADELAVLHEKVPTDVIRKLGLSAMMESAYRKKVNKRRFKIAINTAMIGGSAAAVALPGTQAFAIYGLARASAGLVQEIAEHTMDMSSRAQILEEQLQYLHSTFKTAGKKSPVGRAVSETGGSTLNALLGVDIFPTLDKAKSNLKNLEQHIAHGQVKTQKLIGKINNMLDAANKTEKSLEKNKDRKSRTYLKMEKHLFNQQVVLDSWLSSTTKYTHQLRVAEKKIPKLKATLSSLGTISKAQKIANMGVSGVINLLGIAGGGLADASAAYSAAVEAAKHADAITSVSIAAVGAAKDLFETAKAVHDEVKS